MFGRNARCLAVGLSIPLAAACFHSTAPTGWLSDAAHAERDAYGGWIRLDTRPVASRRTVVEGELIAVSADSVHALVGDSLVSLAWPDVASVDLTAFNISTSSFAMWTLLGVLTTPAQGAFLVLTFPLWTIGGSVFTANASNAPHIRSTDFQLLRPFARFPPGLPAGLDRRQLRRKHSAPGSPSG